MSKIIIADDSQLDRELITEILVNHGVASEKILHAEDGSFVFDLLKNNLVGVIILDWQMPFMDGIETLEALKNNPVYSKIPILMLTSMNEKEDVTEAIIKGVSAYLVKPFKNNLFWDKFKEIVEKNKIPIQFKNGENEKINELLAIFKGENFNFEDNPALIISEDQGYWKEYIANTEDYKAIPFEYLNKLSAAKSIVMEDSPSLIILDYSLGDIRIKLFLKEINDRIKAKDIPIMLCFDNPTQQYQVMADQEDHYRDLGVIEFIDKENDYKQAYEKLGRIVAVWKYPYERLGKLVYIDPAMANLIETAKSIKESRRMKKEDALKSGDVAVTVYNEQGFHLEVKKVSNIKESELKIQAILNLIEGEHYPPKFILDMIRFPDYNITREELDTIVDFRTMIKDFHTDNLVMVISPDKETLLNAIESFDPKLEYRIVDTLSQAEKLLNIKK